MVPSQAIPFDSIFMVSSSAESFDYPLNMLLKGESCDSMQMEQLSDALSDFKLVIPPSKLILLGHTL